MIPRLFQAMAMAMLAAIAAMAPFGINADDVDLLADLFLIATGLAFGCSLTSTRRGGVDFMITFFFLLFLAVPARLQINAGIFPWFARLQDPHMALAFGLMSISLLFYMLGASLAWRRLRRIDFSAGRGVALHVFYSKWAWRIALFAVLCAIAAGPQNLLIARFQREGGFEGFTQQLLFISRSISLLAMVMLLYFVKYGETVNIKRQNFVAALIFLPFFLIINFPPALPRFVLLGVLIALSSVFVNYHSPRMKISIAAAAVPLLLLVFPAIKLIGSGDASVGDVLSGIGERTISEYLLRVDFDGFMQITSTIQYLMEGGSIRWGYNFLGVLLFFVPRALWPGKPIDTGEIVSTTLAFRYTNVSNPLPAEALMALGVIGPVIVFLLLGAFVSYVELSARLKDQRVVNFFAYGVLMGFVAIILRGALNGVAPQFASAFLVLIVIETLRRSRVLSRSPA